MRALRIHQSQQRWLSTGGKRAALAITSALCTSARDNHASAAAAADTSLSSSVQSSTSQSHQHHQHHHHHRQASSVEPTATCILCDEEVSNWMEHSATFRHTARAAVCQELCAPERNAAMLSQLWDHLRLDFELVDAAAAQRTSRRQTRLSSTTKYLRDVNLLQDSIMFEQFASVHLPSSSAPEAAAAAAAIPGEEKSDDIFLDGDAAAEKLNSSLLVHRSFSKLVHVGERALRAELIDRCMRLFPVAPAPEVEAIVELLVTSESLATVFDLLSFKDCLFARTVRVVDASTSSSSSLPPAVQHIVVVPAASDYMTSPTSPSLVARGSGSSSSNNNNSNINVNVNKRHVPTLNLSKLHPNEEVQRALAAARSTPTSHLVALSDEAKRLATLAMIGELSLFSTRDRPTSVASKADADTIVSHVLATHVIENTISELLHYLLQRLVDEGTPVWREYKDSVARLVGAATRPNALKLSAEPKSRLEEDEEKKKMVGNEPTDGATLLNEMLQCRFRNDKQHSQQSAETDGGSGGGSGHATQTNDEDEKHLTFIDDILSRISAPVPKIVWNTIVREGVRETTVPAPQSPSALFALTLPKLTPRAVAPAKSSPTTTTTTSSSSSSSSAAAGKASGARTTIDVSALLQEEATSQPQTAAKPMASAKPAAAAQPRPSVAQPKAATTSTTATPSSGSTGTSSTTTATPIRRLSVVQTSPSSAASRPATASPASSAASSSVPKQEFKPPLGAKPITPGMAKGLPPQQTARGRFQQPPTPIRTMQATTTTAATTAPAAGGAARKMRLVPVTPEPKK